MLSMSANVDRYGMDKGSATQVVLTSYWLASCKEPSFQSGMFYVAVTSKLVSREFSGLLTEQCTE